MLDPSEPSIEQPPRTDVELVELCKKELPYDLNAYSELLYRYETLVFGTCMKMLGNPEDAEEVCQDAFIQVFNKIHQFEGRSAFKTWLYRIVFNLCLNRRKSAATRREREHQAGEQMAHEVETAHKAFFAASPDDRVQETLNRMREDERDIILLRFASDMSLNQMAEDLDLGLSATKMRLYRAMEEFKRIYSGLPSDEPKPTAYE